MGVGEEKIHTHIYMHRNKSNKLVLLDHTVEQNYDLGDVLLQIPLNSFLPLPF